LSSGNGKNAMTNREALLQAAKRCLIEKGYNRTTARDIASAAGVSLAAIGYHFSSKEALLTEALLLAFGEWDRDLQHVLRSAVPADVTPAERFEAIWARIMDTFETHRSLWVANFEIFAQVVSQPEARKVIADKVYLARAGLAAMFLNRDENSIERSTVQTIGAFYHVLLSGLVLQWLIDPASSLSARELTESLRATAEAIDLYKDSRPARAKRRRVKSKNQ
jgi:AcrR family transcriptional regulator